jgi:hypothetical protein
MIMRAITYQALRPSKKKGRMEDGCSLPLSDAAIADKKSRNFLALLL